jgi:hypothetical protein
MACGRQIPKRNDGCVLVVLIRQTAFWVARMPAHGRFRTVPKPS